MPADPRAQFIAARSAYAANAMQVLDITALCPTLHQEQSSAADARNMGATPADA